MSYTPIPMEYYPFTAPYPNGWSDGESGNTPITANILNTNYDIFLNRLTSYNTNVRDNIIAMAALIPENAVEDANYVHTDNNFTTALKTKLEELQIEGNPILPVGPTIEMEELEVLFINGDYFKITHSGGGGGTADIGETGITYSIVTENGNNTYPITITEYSNGTQIATGSISASGAMSGGATTLDVGKIHAAFKPGMMWEVTAKADNMKSGDVMYDEDDIIYSGSVTSYITKTVTQCSKVIVVEANPSETASASLTKLGIDGVVYSVSGGSGSSTLSGLSDVTISSPSNGQTLSYDSSTSKWVNSSNSPYTDVTGTLTAGSTSITLSDNSITSSSTIEVFNDLDIPYNSKSVSTGSITLTFDAQQSDMSVKVRVS